MFWGLWRSGRQADAHNRREIRAPTVACANCPLRSHPNAGAELGK